MSSGRGGSTWKLRAACRGLPASLFFSERTSEVAAAKKVCRSCPVADDCLASALADTGLLGVWGGRTYEERTALWSRGQHRLTKEELMCRLARAAGYPGVWIEVASFRSRATAWTRARELRNSPGLVPPGCWEFKGELVEGGSVLWALFKGDEPGSVAL